MRKFKNGVPMLGKKKCEEILGILREPWPFAVGAVSVELNPKFKRRWTKLTAIKVTDNVGRVFIWYHGYHYRYTYGGKIVPLNLRNKRVLNFYRQLHPIKKKGCKNINKRIRL